ncbi:flagellar basal body-associated protein FliL [Synechocystis sp. FACHB-383]|uniref:flagellar basal body-associated protein FliL n=1 Tax=Synechocystis sp. FACHB-383 TaxID=2692864 RepID=UPI0016856076|nr:flagellar basal body-associated protein FliL [Synechocystis sp. FACHB-383]MBD2655152.1 flagellar basal body-associated protein FliL [Synechocystis sp. FACHB-383]
MINNQAAISTPDAMPARSTIVLIRHAEKAKSGHGLSPAGHDRANAYVQYLQNFTTLEGTVIQWDHIFASKKTDESHRPVLTVTPLSAALGIPIHQHYADEDFAKLAKHIREKREDYAGQNILICWHHGTILKLAAALGASPGTLSPNSAWPSRWQESVYGWLLEIHYTADGCLSLDHTRAINEALMPDDTIAPIYGR